jgi:hypothetical protein
METWPDGHMDCGSPAAVEVPKTHRSDFATDSKNPQIFSIGAKAPRLLRLLTCHRPYFVVARDLKFYANRFAAAFLVLAARVAISLIN